MVPRCATNCPKVPADGPNGTCMSGTGRPSSGLPGEDAELRLLGGRGRSCWEVSMKISVVHVARRLAAVGLSAALLLPLIGAAPVAACEWGCTPG